MDCSGRSRPLDLPPAAFQDFCATVTGEDVLAEAGASSWLRSVIAETMTSTWFRVPDQTDVVQTTLGVRPGDTMADALFFFVFAQMVRETRECLSQAGLEGRIPWSEDMRRSVFPVPQPCTSSLAICDSVWMDDLALLHPVPAADLAIPHLSVVAGTLVDCCLRRDLHPSLDRNKMEAMLTVQGTGSSSVRRDHLSLSEPLIPINSQFWRDARIRVVPRYRHLGGVLHHKGQLHHEIKTRVAQAWCAFSTRKRQLCSQRRSCPARQACPLSDPCVHCPALRLWHLAYTLSVGHASPTHGLCWPMSCPAQASLSGRCQQTYGGSCSCALRSTVH